MTETLEVTWRGLPKRAWFKREKYFYRENGALIEYSPKFWHAGVDIIQTRTGNPPLEKIQLHVRAFCGYEYKFDWWSAINQYGRAMYRPEVKTEALRCKKCEAQLALPPQDREVNSWAIPATTTPMLSQNHEEGPWYPSERIN